MTPGDVNLYIVHIFHLTNALWHTTNIIWDEINGKPPQPHLIPSHKHEEMIRYFKSYTSRNAIFDKLLEFRIAETGYLTDKLNRRK